MDPFTIIKLGAGLLGGFGGNKSSQSESWESWRNSDTEAESQDLSPELLKQLESLFGDTVGSGKHQEGMDAMGSRLKQLMTQAAGPEFDVKGFAKGITDQATAGAQLDLESSINGLLSATGGSESGNSMSALMASKLRNTTAANLAGVASQATATGEQIRQAQQGQLTEGIAGLSQGLMGSIINMIGATRGANSRAKSSTKEHSWGNGTIKQKSGGGLGGLGKLISGLPVTPTE